MSYPSDYYTDIDRLSYSTQLTKRPRVLAVGGGKGGVGKTIVATMLGICLASLGKKTIVLDADFTGANLHGYLNNWNEDLSLNRYFMRRTYDLNELVQPTLFKHLFLIRGVSGLVNTQYKYWEKKKLLRAVRNLDADYVILDLGAGTSYTTIDFFLSADDHIVVLSPDALAIQDSYGFIRVSILRKLERAFHDHAEFMTPVRESADLTRGHSVQSLLSVLERLEDVPESWILLAKNLLRTFTPKIIVNQVRQAEPGQEVQALRLAAKDLLNVQLSFWGVIHHDPVVQAAVKNLRPDLLLSADSSASADVVSIVHRNIIARELNAQKAEENDWQANRQDSKAYQHFRICSCRCIAWQCCADRSGGMPCTITNPVPLSRAASVS